MTVSEKIYKWVKREFNPKYVERVASDLIDVASGTREGNKFEREAVNKILHNE